MNSVNGKGSHAGGQFGSLWKHLFFLSQDVNGFRDRLERLHEGHDAICDDLEGFEQSLADTRERFQRDTAALLQRVGLVELYLRPGSALFDRIFALEHDLEALRGLVVGRPDGA